ncbi:MAG: SDR family NAD(P)-dependent oxidoreductase, partial [Terriglobales bacterium]
MATLSLDNKVAVITGGSRGIGAATVRMFCAAGGRVLFSYVQAKAAAEELVRECGAERCAAMQADLSGTASGEPLVRAAVDRFGRLDILVANHGVWPPEDVSIDRMSEAQWRSTLATNLD